MDKLPDSEIVKALECCRYDDYDYCKECPYRKNKPCQESLIQDTFDLINRLQAENERLKDYKQLYEDLKAEHLETIKLINEGIKTAKAEANKEFAERLKQQKYQSSDWSHGEHPYMVEESDIDNTLEELVGEDNES